MLEGGGDACFALKASQTVGMLRQRDPREVLRQRERSLEECRRRLQRAWQATAQRFESGRLQTQSLRERLIGLTGRGVRERAGNRWREDGRDG